MAKTNRCFFTLSPPLRKIGSFNPPFELFVFFYTQSVSRTIVDTPLRTASRAQRYMVSRIWRFIVYS